MKYQNTIFLKEIQKLYDARRFDDVFREMCPSVESLTDFMKEEMGYSQKNHKPVKGVIGLSGGLDSAVVVALAVKTIGKDNV
ncbi:MAG: hypothetical protein PHU12_03530, partial [Candidatus Aenigmarchaeota archaeon]|nr:hypothetical protein [Candidatus Aenigmarchaeota archaeon]